MRFSSIRFQITALATAVVAVVLAFAGFSLVTVQRALLTDSIDEALTQRADDIIALLAGSPLPEEISQGGREGFAQLIAERASVGFSQVRLGQYYCTDCGRWVEVTKEPWSETT